CVALSYGCCMAAAYSAGDLFTNLIEPSGPVVAVMPGDTFALGGSPYHVGNDDPAFPVGREHRIGRQRKRVVFKFGTSDLFWLSDIVAQWCQQHPGKCCIAGQRPKIPCGDGHGGIRFWSS